MPIEFLGGSGLNIGGQRKPFRFFGGGGLSYLQKILVIAPDSLIGYWPGDEASGTAALDRSGNARNGVYSNITLGGVGIGDGLTAPIYNGNNSQAALYSASLAGAWNGETLTLNIWINADDWTDGVARGIYHYRADSNNQIFVYKATNTGRITISNNIGATGISSANIDGLTAGWHCVTLVIDYPSTQVIVYVDGLLKSVRTSINQWSGALDATYNWLGRTTVSSNWLGRLAHHVLWSAVFAPPDVSRAANCNGHVTVDGDSRSTYSLPSTGYPQMSGFQNALVAKHYGWQGVAVSGQTVAQMSADFATQIAPLYRSGLVNTLVVWGGVNDAAGGADAATIWARFQTYCNTARAAGFRVLLCTEIDAQSAELNAVNWHTTIWPALNTLIRAGYAAVADDLIDLGANAALQDATNLTNFNADKLHQSATGQGVVSGLVGAKL